MNYYVLSFACYYDKVRICELRRKPNFSRNISKKYPIREIFKVLQNFVKNMDEFSKNMQNSHNHSEFFSVSFWSI